MKWQDQALESMCEKGYYEGFDEWRIFTKADLSIKPSKTREGYFICSVECDYRFEAECKTIEGAIILLDNLFGLLRQAFYRLNWPCCVEKCVHNSKDKK